MSLKKYNSQQIILKNLLLIILNLPWTFASGLLKFLVFSIWILFDQCLSYLLQLYWSVSLYCSNLFFLTLFSSIFDFYEVSHSLFKSLENLSHYFYVLLILFAPMLINECEPNLWILSILLLHLLLCTLIKNERVCQLNQNGHSIHLVLHLQHIRRCRLLF